MDKMYNKITAGHCQKDDWTSVDFAMICESQESRPPATGLLFLKYVISIWLLSQSAILNSPHQVAEIKD